MDRDLVTLIAEDNEDEALLIHTALVALGVAGNAHIVRDGQEVIEYLSGRGPYEDREAHPLPQVLITDLKMPRMNGFEVLEWMRSRPEHAVMPTMVFSSSAWFADVNRAYDLGANAYMVKPATLEGLKEVLRTMLQFWRACVRPSKNMTEYMGRSG